MYANRKLDVPHPEPVGERFRLAPRVGEDEYRSILLHGLSDELQPRSDLREGEDGFGENLVLIRCLGPDHLELQTLLYRDPDNFALGPSAHQEFRYGLGGPYCCRQPDCLEFPARYPPQ